jgi:hypothetical protein
LPAPAAAEPLRQLRQPFTPPRASRLLQLSIRHAAASLSCQPLRPLVSSPLLFLRQAGVRHLFLRFHFLHYNYATPPLIAARASSSRPPFVYRLEIAAGWCARYCHAPSERRAATPAFSHAYGLSATVLSPRHAYADFLFAASHYRHGISY